MTFTSWLNGLQTIASILLSLSGLFLIVIVYLGIRKMTREIKELGKEVPKWIDQYDKDKMKRLAIERAKLGLQQ